MIPSTRNLRIARGIQAILMPEDIPELSEFEVEEEDDLDEDDVFRKFTTSDGVLFGVTFTPMREEGDYWEVEFWPLNSRQKSEHPTEVLRKVVAIIREFLQDHDVGSLGFIGMSSKHDKLYRKMLERLLPDAAWEMNDSEVVMYPEKIKEGRVAILREIPEVGPHEFDSAQERFQNRQRVRKFFNTSDGPVYKVAFTQKGQPSQGTSGIWEVSFDTGFVNPKLNRPGEVDWSEAGLDFSKYPYSKQHSEVLGKVAGVVRNFVAEYQPSALSFFGSTESRDKVYHAMLKRFMPGQWGYDDDLNEDVLVLNAEAWEEEKARVFP